MKPASYIGRFAPSPTGPLHFGSLIAALGSYLQARQAQGRWLLRIEDLDPPREKPGASDDILRSLESFGFEWDGPVIYQSRRSDIYDHYLHRLKRDGLLYACDCSRKKIIADSSDADNGIYPGTCRQRALPPGPGRALRLRVDEPADCGFIDRIQGRFQQNVASEVGDFVLKRRDGLYAYQLAVVIDDAEQAVSEVVRGTDLLDNTPRQIYLQRQLGFRPPGYLHLPLALNPAGEKLSKQTFAPSLENSRALQSLFAAWHFLGQESPAAKLKPDDLPSFWAFAIENWNPDRIPTSELGFTINPKHL
ncbi:MAG: tRNA glutamyl-Q(34) synthetase GluQRS [Gammaproteobacteria bacterium]|nr:tRNA glutamyl-Q(34) synthetase GluQRS [Gammaproteobacteria bacterium]